VILLGLALAAWLGCLVGIAAMAALSAGRDQDRCSVCAARRRAELRADPARGRHQRADVGD
jgi:hypothetical protein